MRSVGIRELRQRASELLRAVEGGETVEVTDRGRPVALLTPLPKMSRFDQMVARGEIQPATTRIADLPDPLPPGEDELPSVVLERLRRDER